MSLYPKITQLKTVEAFRARLAELRLDLPVEGAQDYFPWGSGGPGWDNMGPSQ